MASSELPEQQEQPQGEKKTVIKRKIFKRRNPTLKKKALELRELCNVPVCVISYGPDGTLQTWPESRKDVEAVVDKYRNNDGAFKFSLGSLKSKTYTKNNNRGDLADGEPERDEKEKVEEFEKDLARWDGWLDEQHEEETLASFCTFLESKIREINDRIELLKSTEKPI